MKLLTSKSALPDSIYGSTDCVASMNQTLIKIPPELAPNINFQPNTVDMLKLISTVHLLDSLNPDTEK